LSPPSWRYFGGFCAHNRVRVAAEDREGRMKFADYMLRTPMSLEKMSYDAATATVIYRSKARGAQAQLPGDARGRVGWRCSVNTFPIATSIWCATVAGIPTARGERAKALKAQERATKPAQ
jgi:hypothetical protein